MSVHSIRPAFSDGNRPADADLVGMAMRSDPDAIDVEEIHRLMASPRYRGAYEDGVIAAALLFQAFEDCAAVLTDEDIEDMFLGLVMDEVKRLREIENKSCAVVAAARFAGYFKTIGGYLFNAWKDRQS